MVIKNRLIYSSKINSTELLRSLALFSLPSFDLRIFKFNELLEEANILLGYPIKENLLSSFEIEEKVLGFFVDKVNLPNPSYQDLKHFLKSINDIRMHIVDINEKEALEKIFSLEKNNKSLQLLKSFYYSYNESLAGYLDSILLARKIIDYVKRNNIQIFEEISYFKEDYLSPLELELIKSISKKVSMIDVLSLFNDKKTSKAKIASLMPRYGVRNEVCHVINDIIKNKYPLDTCQIVLVNNSDYVHELFKAKMNYQIPMTFATGLPINLSDAYKLFTSLIQLENKYFYDVNGYLNLFSSESFDTKKLGLIHKKQVAQLLGRMKICFDKNKNDDYLSQFKNAEKDYPWEVNEILKKIDREIYFNKEEILNETFHVIDEFSKGVAYIIKEYTRQNIFDQKFHSSSVEFITSSLEYASSDFFPHELRNSYLETIGNKYLSREVFSDEAIHITSLSSCLSSFKEHTYILGLNSAYYPGSLTEDFLFPDDLYFSLSGIKNITETHLNNKNEYLKTVIDTYLSLGLSLSLSYNSQEIKEVRELNPCSVLLDYAEEFYQEENTKNKKENKEDALTEYRKKCSYYDDEISILSSIAGIAINNNDVKTKKHEQNQIFSKEKDLLNESYSPSTLPKFLSCPLKFYLDNIERVDDTVSYDPLRPLGGSRFGDLLHLVMEHFTKDEQTASKNEIVSYAEKLYDIYFSIDRSITDNNVEKRTFLHSVENTYEFLKKNFVLNFSKAELSVGSKKEEKDIAKIGNISFHGSIDLVTRDQKCGLVIIDYKTGSHIEHIDNDPESCIQGLIYAQLYEIIYGEPISKLLFYYTRFNKVVEFDSPCSLNSKKLLLEKVNLFEVALKKLKFDIAQKEDENICKYCKYSNICKIEEKKEEKNDEE